MTATVVPIPTKSPLPSDLPAELRALAEAVEHGDVKTMVIAFARDGVYEIYLPSSLTDSLVLAALLHERVIGKFRA